MEQRSRTLTDELLDRRAKAVPRGVHNVAPVFVVRAEGAHVWDAEGRKLLDFTAGLGVLNVGHRHPRVVTAIREQLDAYLHTCFHVAMHEPYVALAERLNAITPGRFPKKTVLVNSGAEGVENAVKIARAATGRPGIIAFEHGFHGRTLMGMSLTSRVSPYKNGFGPFAPGVYRVSYPYPYRCPRQDEAGCTAHVLDELETLFALHVDPKEIGAVIVEPVTGEGGFIVPPRDFLPALSTFCRARGILLIVDEVQTGFGRTGAFFAVEQAGVEPDLLVTGKSLAGGLPLAAVTGRAELMDAPGVGGLGGTYGGNPLACVAALAVIETIIAEDLLTRAHWIGDFAMGALSGLAGMAPLVGEVRGLGAMVAVELVEDRETKHPAQAQTALVLRRSLERGLLLLKCGAYDNVIRLLIPLTIEEGDLQRGLDILTETIRESG